MLKQKLIRWVIFAVLAGGILWQLQSQVTTGATDEKKPAVLPAKTTEKLDQIKELIEEQEIGEKALGIAGEILPILKKNENNQTQAEVIVEEKVREIIKEIQSLPADQVEEVKKKVFCNEVCETTCGEMCR